jgi:hypothetical protein
VVAVCGIDLAGNLEVFHVFSKKEF